MIVAFPDCRKWTKLKRSSSPCAASVKPRRTVRRKRIDFLAAYAECGNVAEACRRSMTSRSTHYHRLKNDPVYRQAFLYAHEEAEDRMLEVARRRATGWQEPVVHQGKVVGYVTTHSDRLLMLLLQYYLPEKFGALGGRRRRNLLQSSHDPNEESEPLNPPQVAATATWR